MAKFPSYPILYDEVLQINISILKKYGYLNPNQIKTGSLTWSRFEKEIGGIKITLDTLSSPPFMELNYVCNNEKYQYKILLVSTPSNLGNGLIWYFLCPVTNKRCRKLYLINGYFLHRDAFPRCMYECQTRSKKSRTEYKIFNSFLSAKKLSNHYR